MALAKPHVGQGIQQYSRMVSIFYTNESRLQDGASASSSKCNCINCVNKADFEFSCTYEIQPDNLNLNKLFYFPRSCIFFEFLLASHRPLSCGDGPPYFLFR